ncbi:MAG: hypothetical protein AAGA85_27690 [Bacteroidota bacterium]
MKFFLIILLLTYVIYKVGGVLGRIIMVGRDLTGEADKRKNPKGSNVNLDYVPGEKNQKKGKGYKGGEYVDYEEV